MNNKTQNIFSAIGAGITWFAVIGQLFIILEYSTTSVGETLIRYFSFFTILTNIVVAVFFTAVLFNSDNRICRLSREPGTMTAVVVYISVVGLVYQLLLRPIWHPVGFQSFINELLHSVVPMFFIVYWYFFEDKKLLRWTAIPAWLIYPLIYSAFIVVRGAFSDYYPYPFIDVVKLGYPVAILNALGLEILFCAFSAFFIGIGKLTTD
jgi:hypothetical protein